MVTTDGRWLLQPLKLVKVPIEDVELKSRHSSSRKLLLPVAAPPAHGNGSTVLLCTVRPTARIGTGLERQRRMLGTEYEFVFSLILNYVHPHYPHTRAIW